MYIIHYFVTLDECTKVWSFRPFSISLLDCLWYDITGVGKGGCSEEKGCVCWQGTCISLCKGMMYRFLSTYDTISAMEIMTFDFLSFILSSHCCTWCNYSCQLISFSLNFKRHLLSYICMLGANLVMNFLEVSRSRIVGEVCWVSGTRFLYTICSYTVILLCCFVSVVIGQVVLLLPSPDMQLI